MGNWFSQVWEKLFAAKRDVRLLMIGLDNAGKSTILYKMKTNELVETGATIGFNSEEFQLKNFNIKVWDLAGQEKMRTVWKYYYSSVDGIVFVVDASSKERLGEAREEVQHLLADKELSTVPLLIFANKQDLPDSLSANEIYDVFQLQAIKQRKIKI